MKQIIIAVLAITAIIGIAVVSGGGDTVNAEPSNNFFGAEEGVITVTEYGDFECPACAGFYPIFSQMKDQFANEVRFEYKHFPLVQIHTNATAAHRAAEAAANQGKFWEMHDLIYERQAQWNGQATTNPAPIFEEYARELELDMDQYAAEVSTSDILGTINADVALGKDLGFTSTPTFVIDGKTVEDTTSIASVELFAAAIQDAIDAKTGVDSSEDAASDDAAESSEEAPANEETQTDETQTTETSGE